VGYVERVGDLAEKATGFLNAPGYTSHPRRTIQKNERQY